MFIARQPIFNKVLDVYGYELLFRLSPEAKEFGGVESQAATAAVISGLFEAGLDSIVDNKYAFINFDEEIIHSDSIELISKDKLVIEMLEDIKVDNKLTDRLQEIKNKGYKIALDDFYEDYENYPLVPLAEIIKFDLLETPLEIIADVVSQALGEGKILLAEKVETKEIFLQAKKMGFHLFQGYFFSKPNIISQASTDVSSKTQYARLLMELKKEEPSYDVLARIIEQDVNLAYKFMRVISRRSKENIIESIKSGLTYMGLNDIERWVSILMLQDLGQGKPEELIKVSLIRTKFAEEIVINANNKQMKHEASMMGLFSTLDAMLDQTMEEALKDIALSKLIKDALIEKKGALYPVYELLLAYEKGDWEKVRRIAKEEDVDLNVLGKEYLESIKWSSEISGLIK